MNDNISAKAQIFWAFLLASNDEATVCARLNSLLENPKYEKRLTYDVIVELFEKGYFGLCFKNLDGEKVTIYRREI